jgi:hypothetical protein
MDNICNKTMNNNNNTNNDDNIKDSTSSMLLLQWNSGKDICCNHGDHDIDDVYEQDYTYNNHIDIVQDDNDNDENESEVESVFNLVPRSTKLFINSSILVTDTDSLNKRSDNLYPKNMLLKEIHDYDYENYNYSPNNNNYDYDYDDGYGSVDESSFYRTSSQLNKRPRLSVDYSETPSPTSSIDSDMCISVYNFDDDHDYNYVLKNQNNLNHKKFNFINNEKELDYQNGNDAENSELETDEYQYNRSKYRRIYYESSLYLNAENIITSAESINKNGKILNSGSECPNKTEYTDEHNDDSYEEKDQLFGLGIEIPSIGGLINNNNIQNYICTLENIQYEDHDLHEITELKKRLEAEIEDNILESKKAEIAENEIHIKKEPIEVHNNKKIENKKQITKAQDKEKVKSLRKRKLKHGNNKKIKKHINKLKKVSSNTDIVKISKHKMPFICKECGKGFPRKSNHDSHIRMHLKIKPHICQFCCKGFVRRSDLNRHERSLHLKSTFRCLGKCDNNTRWGCGHIYSRKDGLRKHWKSYQGQKCLSEFMKNNKLNRKYDINNDLEMIIELTKLFNN